MYKHRKGRQVPLFLKPSPHHFVTRITTLLLSPFLDVVTVTKPVVAPLGTVVLISVLEMTVNAAALPLL
jgi:hypothetical protein